MDASLMKARSLLQAYRSGNEAYGTPADSGTVINAGGLAATAVAEISAVATVASGELSTVARTLASLTV
jgi:hypothetical protein